MIYTVSSGTLNPSIPYHTTPHGWAPYSRIWDPRSSHCLKQCLWPRTGLCGGCGRRTVLRNLELNARNEDSNDIISLLYCWLVLAEVCSHWKYLFFVYRDWNDLSPGTVLFLDTDVGFKKPRVRVKESVPIYISIYCTYLLVSSVFAIVFSSSVSLTIWLICSQFFCQLHISKKFCWQKLFI